MTTPYDVPLRVLMTADTVRGVWRYAIDLCRGLAELGIEIELAAMGPKIDPPQCREAEGIPGVTLHFFRGRLEWMDAPWLDVDASLGWLAELARSTGAHVLHANTLCHVLPGIGLPTVVTGHSCLPSWFEAVRGSEPPARHDVYRQRVRASLQAADLVVAPTASMLSALQRHHGPFPRFTVVFSGRCFDGLAPRRKLPYVLAAGRLWDEAKNAAAVATAASRWSWPVYMAGSTCGPDGAEAAPAGVELLGSLPPRELAQWMSEAAIFVAPARYEPLGLTILEAAAAGCALVLGAIPSLREVWGTDAVFVDPDDPDALAHAVARLIDDEEQRALLGSRARTRALRLHHRRMAVCYSALYHDLIATRLFLRGAVASAVGQ
jgi:glycosyltransferase involved in cell wall biosynthesis